MNTTDTTMFFTIHSLKNTFHGKYIVGTLSHSINNAFINNKNV